VIEPVVELLPSFRGTPLKRHVRLAKKMVRSGSLAPHDRFIADSIYLSASEQHELLTEGQWDAWAGDTQSRHKSHLDRVSHADFLNQMMYLDSKMFMPSLNLNYNDKMSMASSVEVRVPFLDRAFVEWAACTIPPALKLHGDQTKHIFRRAMQPLLPTEVLRQPKAGFGAPIDYWLSNDLRELVDDLLSPAGITKRGIFNPSTVQRYIKAQRSGRRDVSYQIWTLLTLELWMQIFID
jgi:asparagine synthase (glutamine-hydrolysing)